MKTDAGECRSRSLPESTKREIVQSGASTPGRAESSNLKGESHEDQRETQTQKTKRPLHSCPKRVTICMSAFTSKMVSVFPVEKEYARCVTALNLSLIHISEPTRLGMISYAVFCLKKKKKQSNIKF